ncbi:MAG: hypothetical protein SCALA701_15740 [Candidatus Scalindua sp.]|nr:MAG: hypothetical protein SCALA701_15740 [Candidatus Scalindua sp.]
MTLFLAGTGKNGKLFFLEPLGDNYAIFRFRVEIVFTNREMIRVETLDEHSYKNASYYVGRDK